MSTVKPTTDWVTLDDFMILKKMFDDQRKRISELESDRADRDAVIDEFVDAWTKADSVSDYSDICRIAEQLKRNK